MRKLTTHPKLKNLLPSLTEKERQGLEADILKHGCLTPIVTWNNIIVDGHYRHAICEKYGLSYKTKEIQFKSIVEAMLWVWQHQEHRRNLRPYQRAELALKFKPMLAMKAKEKEAIRKSTEHDLIERLPEINTRNEIAKMAGVSEGTLGKAEYLIKYADEETKQRLRKGETTIYREYNRLKGTLQPNQDVEPEKPITKPMLVLPPTPVGHFRTIWNIDTMTPADVEELVKAIRKRFGLDYLKELVFVLFVHIVHNQYPDATRQLLQQLYNLHYTPSFTERRHGIPQL